MNITKFLIPAAAALALAGCSTVRPGCGCGSCCTCTPAPAVDPNDPVIGNWSGKLPYGGMFASSLIFSRENGKPKAYVLYRWGSPEWCEDVTVIGNTFSFRHPYGVIYRGTVEGDVMKGEIASYDAKTKKTGAFEPFTGWRNAPACPCATSKGVRLGEAIDLLADGLDGWQLMSTTAKNGWSVTTEGGKKILSNKLGLNKDGGWAGGGANLMTKRADFGDFNLDYDVRVPAKSNSGVYLRGRFECQVVDSYGKPVDRHNMAAYYGRVTPSVPAEKKPGEWQHVNVTLANRHITVVLNGTTIIDDAEITGVTGGAIDADMDAPGPIYLQGDHSDADYRNMILRPVIGK